MSAVVARAQESGFADVNEFVSQLISRISERQSEVENLAIEGINSGPSERWKSSDIEDIKEHLRTKFGS
jgi:hypothetical protein